MRWAIAAVSAFLIFLATYNQLHAVAGLPGQTLEPRGIYMPEDGNVVLTSKLGDLSCRGGSISLHHPDIVWPDGRITDPVLIKNYGSNEAQSVTIGPFTKNTRLVFALEPKSVYCGGEIFLSNDPLHAKISHRGGGNWKISWEDSTHIEDIDFNDVYVEVKVTPTNLSEPPSVLADKVCADRYTEPRYKLPWCLGESRQVWQIPRQGTHGRPYLANAYDFGGEFKICAPEEGRVLWVEDGFPAGGCDENLRNRTNVIVLKTSANTQITFVHLRQGSAEVKIGDWVTQGQMLAFSGNSGYSCSTHLHMEFQRSCHTLYALSLLNRGMRNGTISRETLAWSCPTRPLFSDGFWINDVFHERLESNKWYESDNQNTGANREGSKSLRGFYF